MEIKNCGHCGSEAKIKRRSGFDYGSQVYLVECTCCKIKTDDFHTDPFAKIDADKEAVDVWNSRVEQDAATIDRWFNEATEQRSRLFRMGGEVLDLIPEGNQYLDPPDGGSVAVTEQLRRYVQDLKLQIENSNDKATEQRARAELLQMQVDELSEALNQARRMLAYAGKLQ